MHDYYITYIYVYICKYITAWNHLENVVEEEEMIGILDLYDWHECHML